MYTIVCLTGIGILGPFVERIELKQKE